MGIDITEKIKFGLEFECEHNNFLFREETNLTGVYYCKASISIYLKPKVAVMCSPFCQHHGKFYRTRGNTHGHYLCNHVPKKNNS